jgi:hypothetical protein
MPAIHYINYQGLAILYTDLENATADQALAILAQSPGLVAQQPKESVFSLINVKGMRFNSQLVATGKEVTRQNKPYVLATAVYGLDGLLSYMVNSVLGFSGRSIRTFGSLPEAKDWLWHQHTDQLAEAKLA